MCLGCVQGKLSACVDGDYMQAGMKVHVYWQKGVPAPAIITSSYNFCIVSYFCGYISQIFGMVLSNYTLHIDTIIGHMLISLVNLLFILVQMKRCKNNVILMQ